MELNARKPTVGFVMFCGQILERFENQLIRNESLSPGFPLA
jgi:hypothetical protein